MKGSYGWDDPKTIRRRFIIAICAVAGGGILFEIVNNFAEGFAWTLLWLSVVLAFICLVGAIRRIHSSQKGKFKVLDHLVKELKLKGGEECLDVGCGRGALLIAIAHKLTTGKIYGVDIWREQDQSANTPFNATQNIHREGVDGRAEVETADARELPYAEASFDCVVSSLVLHHLPTAAASKKALSEMVRVLRPGGKIGLLDYHHIAEYRHYLEEKGFTCVQHGPYWRMFPPATMLIAQKK